MSQLNKSTVGLGKVINRLQTDGNDLAIINTRLSELEMTNFISGNWNTIVNNPNVSLSSGIYQINLDNNQAVSITLNLDGQVIKLSGGINGKAYYFTFSNPASNTVFWDNLRTTDAEVPMISIGTPIIPAITTMTIVKMGNEYYLMNLSNRVG